MAIQATGKTGADTGTTRAAKEITGKAARATAPAVGAARTEGAGDLDTAMDMDKAMDAA